MLNPETGPHQMVETGFLSREIGLELSEGRQLRVHAYCIAQIFTWRKGIIPIELACLTLIIQPETPSGVDRLGPQPHKGAERMD